MRSLWVFGLIAVAVRTASAENPYNDTNLVSMFDGTTLTGWTQSKAGEFVVMNGTIHGTGASRGFIYYKTQVGDFRWIFNVRQVKAANHNPNVLFWGTGPEHDALGAIQFQAPSNYGWDYRAGHNNGNGFKTIHNPHLDIKKWSQCEIIANHTTGLARLACCQLTEGVTCKAVEIVQFEDKTAGRVGTLGIQIHNAGVQDEYKSLYFESPPTNADKFITA
jgi:hypothetical protein